jgi:hypothetical protein
VSTTRVRRVTRAGRLWQNLSLCSSLYLCAATLGCGRDADSWDQAVEPPHLARVALRESQAWEYVLVPASRAGLTFGGRQQKWRGSVAVTSGRLSVDAHDLGATRAALTFDLGSMVLDGQASGSPVALSGAAAPSLTEQSLNWLELGRESRNAARPELRYARFTLLSLGSSHEEAADAPTVMTSHSGAIARRVRLRATGELELHGYRLPCTASLVATFEWAASELDAPPRRIELATTEPVGIDLLGHGVTPRDARGEILAESLAALRKLPRDPVQLDVRWVAERASAPTRQQVP